MRDRSLDEKAIFRVACNIESSAARDEYLQQVCGDNSGLYHQVLRLVEMQDDNPDFLESPAAGVAATMALPLAEQPGTIIGPYKLLQVIGEGGMGVVYMAEQSEPVSRRVALKIIKPGMDTGQVIARFEAERQALAMMDHPNIAKVLDAGATESGHPYFAMELVKGIPISEYCDEQHFTPKERLELFVKVCHAVQHAHQKGVIHRDLKPSNVLVAEYDHEAVPKIIDFGVAKATSQKLTEKTMFTQYGQIVGTLEYMSPEQAKLNQLDIDTRSDVYSLGVLLYQLLTGTTPLERERLQSAAFEEMLRIIREEEPPKPSTRISTVGKSAVALSAHRRTTPQKLHQFVRGELDWVVMRALDKDRNRRYESASSFAADVERFLNVEAVEACPPSTAYRLHKFVRRNRGPVIAVAALLLMLCLGLTGTSIGLYRTRVAENEASQEAANARVAENEASQEAANARVAENEATLEAANARVAERKANQEATKAIRAQEAERRLNFRLAFDRGLAFCDQGHVSHGMLWLARALELAPPEQTAMRRVIRANLNAWRRELHSLEAIFPQEQTVLNAVFSPDGKLVLTASADRSAQLWDVETGSRIGTAMMHDHDVHEAIFSPDGSRILTGSYDNTARLWETQTCVQIHSFTHQGTVLAVAFSPDSSWLVTGTIEGTVTIWDAESFVRIGELPKHAHTVHDVAISSDGQRILTSCHDKSVRLWDRDNTRLPIATFEHETRVPTADFRRPHCDQIVTGDSDGNVYLWDIAAAIGDDDKKLETKAKEFVGGPWRHRSGVHQLRVSLDGSRILTASFDNTAGLWYPDRPAQAPAAFDHRGGVQGVAFSPNGSLIVTACEDHTARLWQPAAGQSIRIFEHEGSVDHEAVYTADGLYILTKTNESTALVRQAITDTRICELSQQRGIHSLAVSPDRSKFLTGNANSTAQLWDAATGESIGEPFQQGGVTWHVAFSSDGARMLTGALDGMVELRDAGTGDLIKQLEIGARVFGVAFSPDGSRIAVASSDRLARLYNTTDYIPRLLTGHQARVVAVAFSPDGARVVTGGHDNTVRVWDVATGIPVSEPMQLRGPIWYPVTLAFSPDGRTVVTGCDDQTVRIWDVATAKPIGPALTHNAGVRMAAFSSDGAQIRTGTAVGTVRLWDASIKPLDDNVERINLWVQVATGFELDSDGAMNVIDARTWQERQRQLLELGGPPGD